MATLILRPTLSAMMPVGIPNTVIATFVMPMRSM